VTAEAFISMLAAAHLDSSATAQAWVDSICQSLPDGLEVLDSANSLSSAVQQCHQYSGNNTVVSFKSMVAYIQLAVQCQK
jgi:dsRNA-specific ribonuclease